MNLPKKVHIVEMCPRDGFQGEKTMIPTEKKIQFINMLSRTGLNDIQATSLVHPKAIPQLADGDEVLAKIDRPAGVQWKVLVPNLRGLERSFPYKPDKINLMMSVSESHSRANANKSVDEALKGHAEVAKAALDAGIGVIGQMSCFFGCPFEGEVPWSQRERIIRAYLDMGVQELGLADTIGVANPRQTYALVSLVMDMFPGIPFSLHMHNTRDMALANILAAMQAGATAFDSAVGGLGGCPYVPNATGNIATEDLVNMLHEMGIETGVDLDKVIEAARFAQTLIDHPLAEMMVRAGKRTDLKPAPKEQHKVG